LSVVVLLVLALVLENLTQKKRQQK
jgi:hypothetical protein